MNKAVLIAGATGMVGKELQQFLLSQNYVVKILTRNKKLANQTSIFHWDIEQKIIDTKAFENVSVIINLCGANVASKRWTKDFKKEIIKSRVDPAHFLLATVKKNNFKISQYISASAIGYYANSEEKFDETAPKGNAFLSDVCELWENAAMSFKNELQIPTTCIRIGVVLGKNGGFIQQTKTLFKLGLGSGFGNMKQYMSVIHIKDLCKTFLHIIEKENQAAEIYNAVMPKAYSNKEVTKALAKAVKASQFLPAVPAFILKIILGEFSYELLVSHQIVPKKLLTENFEYQFSTLENALADCVS